MAGRTGVENTLRLRKRVFSPPDVAGRPDRSPGQVSGKRAEDHHTHRGARIRASWISYHH